MDALELAAIVRDAATRHRGGLPDESLLLLAEFLEASVVTPIPDETPYPTVALEPDADVRPRHDPRTQYPMNLAMIRVRAEAASHYIDTTSYSRWKDYVAPTVDRVPELLDEIERLRALLKIQDDEL